MSPRTVKQNQEIQDVSRAKIVESALTLFAQHGFESTTTRQIAEHAGISHGLMYHYFAGKDDLLKTVFQRCVEPLHKIMLGAEDIHDPAAKVEYIIRATFSTVREDQIAATLFYTLRTQAAFLNLMREDTIQWVGALRAIFLDCFTALGHAQPEVDAALLYALLEGMVRHYLLEPETFPLAAATERVIDQYCRKEALK